MEILTKEYSFPSKSGLCDIYAQSVAPMDYGKLKGVVQIAHGMAEHGGRYGELAARLCKAGYAVFINDHVGHGKSVSSEEMLGYFGKKNGYMNFVDDCKQLTDIAKSEYKGLPFIFFGHSMGSFIAREYTAHFGNEIDGAVYCGTSGPNPGASVGGTLANMIAKRKGEMYRSEFINNIAFGSYNKKTEKKTPFDWLTKDSEVVEKYINDPHCGFLFTATGYRDLFNLLQSVSAKKWYTSVPSELPILLMAGEDDPVGAYGKGVKQVFRTLKETKHKNVTLNLYPGDRHEIHNELDKEQVIDDLIKWLDSVVGDGEVEVDKAVNDAVEEFNSKIDEQIQKSKESINEAIENTNEVVEQIVQDAAEQAKVDAESISVEDKLIEETVEPQTVEEIVAETSEAAEEIAEE